MVCPDCPPCNVQNLPGLATIICAGVFGLMAESAFVLFLVGCRAWDDFKNRKNGGRRA
jgi:hypothetical protein